MTGAANEIRILAVDDHYVTRYGIRRLLSRQPDLCIVGEAGDGAAAVTLYQQLEPDLVLMDLKMEGVDGVSATRMLTARDPDARILILSSFDTAQLVRQACQAGAAGFVLKEAGSEEILAAIRAVAAGQANMPIRLWKHITGAAEREELSVREIQVLQMLEQGLKTHEVAKALDLSLGTVKMYVSRAFAKLGVGTRAEAVAEAHRRGLL